MTFNIKLIEISIGTLNKNIEERLKVIKTSIKIKYWKLGILHSCWNPRRRDEERFFCQECLLMQGGKYERTLHVLWKLHYRDEDRSAQSPEVCASPLVHIFKRAKWWIMNGWIIAHVRGFNFLIFQGFSSIRTYKWYPNKILIWEVEFSN